MTITKVLIVVIALLSIGITSAGGYIGYREIDIRIDQRIAEVQQQAVQQVADARLQGQRDMVNAIYNQASARGQIQIANQITTEEGESQAGSPILLRLIRPQTSEAEASEPETSP